MTNRSRNEIEHGAKLASSNPEVIWGWGTKAGLARGKRRFQLITDGANLKPGAKVLEIGCGSGLLTEALVLTGATIIAVDISNDLLAIARQRGLPKERVQFLEKRFEDCDIDGPFDAVVGSSVLHHLDIVPAINKIYSLLKPGGVMSFAEPNMLNPQIMVQKNIHWIKEKMGDSPDETAFFKWQIKGILKKAGFVQAEAVPFDWLHPHTPEKMISLVSSIGNGFEKLPILREFAGSLFIHSYKPA